MPRTTTSKPLIYTASQSLDVQYTFNHCPLDTISTEDAAVTVYGADTHALLYAGYQGLMSTRKELKYKNGNLVYVNDEDIKQANFADATVTFLYTDTDTDEGYLGKDIEQQSFALATEKTERILSSLDFYDAEKKYKQPKVAGNKSIRDPYFNLLLRNRIKSFSEISENYDTLSNNAVASEAALDSMISGHMFHETFHHSEQAIMHYLSSLAGIEMLTATALSSKVVYLYGIVLDIYTQRVLCGNCNVALLGMQNSRQDGFLFDFSSSLTKERIEVRPQLMLSIRVSASQSVEVLRLVDDKNKLHSYNPDSTCQIFQAENRALGTQKIIKNEGYSLATFPGAFFVSRSFSKVKLEDAIQVDRKADIVIKKEEPGL